MQKDKADALCGYGHGMGRRNVEIQLRTARCGNGASWNALYVIARVEGINCTKFTNTISIAHKKVAQRIGGWHHFPYFELLFWGFLGHPCLDKVMTKRPSKLTRNF
eukprot:s5748_g1.t1